MRRTLSQFLAAISLACSLGAAMRPRYGGVLRLELRAAIASLDPGEDNSDARLSSLVFEPLVRIDDNGHPQPCLAVSWQHDPGYRRWEFRLRTTVKFHDGYPLTAVAAGGQLQRALSGPAVGISGDTIVIQSDRSMAGLPIQLADIAITARSADGSLVGTGPFRVVRWDPGRHASLAAHENYWGGRPFLDALEIEIGRPPREQLADLELGKADLVEILSTDLRRAAERGRRTWTSAPVELLALAFTGNRDARLRKALAAAIDRAAIHNVLLQRQGEVSAALLPQSLSGYAFLFPAAPDLTRARKLAAELPAAARTLVLGYDPSEPQARIIAERIALNARDAGITLQVAPQAKADVRLVRRRIPFNAPRALRDFAASLGLPEPSLPALSAKALYTSERQLLEGSRRIPLAHLPETWASAPKVRSWLAPLVRRGGELRLADAWLEPEKP